MTRSSQSTIWAPGEANGRTGPAGVVAGPPFSTGSCSGRFGAVIDMGATSWCAAVRARCSLMLHSTLRAASGRGTKAVRFVTSGRRSRGGCGSRASKRYPGTRVRDHGRPPAPGPSGPRHEPAPAGGRARRLAKPDLAGRDRPGQAVRQHPLRDGQRAGHLARRPALHGHAGDDLEPAQPSHPARRSSSRIEQEPDEPHEPDPAPRSRSACVLADDDPASDPVSSGSGSPPSPFGTSTSSS